MTSIANDTMASLQQFVLLFQIQDTDEEDERVIEMNGVISPPVGTGVDPGFNS
jgi:hypothetical protein